MAQLFTDREAWLTEAASLIIDDILTPIIDASAYGYERPPYRISVGFPKHSRGGKSIAVCFTRAASSDGVNEVFINPEIDDPVEVLDKLTHELIHAFDDCESGHRNFFAHVARKAGLEGALTRTVAGDELRQTLQSYADLLGPFPHRKMQLDTTHKKQKTRMRRVSCSSPECGFHFRTTAVQIAKLANPTTCPACQTGILFEESGAA